MYFVANSGIRRRICPYVSPVRGNLRETFRKKMFKRGIFQRVITVNSLYLQVANALDYERIIYN